MTLWFGDPWHNINALCLIPGTFPKNAVYENVYPGFWLVFLLQYSAFDKGYLMISYLVLHWPRQASTPLKTKLKTPLQYTDLCEILIFLSSSKFFFYLPQNVGLSLFSMFFPCSSHSFMLISSVISSVIQPPTYCQTYSPGKLVENILRCTFIILGWLPLKFNFTHILWFQIPCRGVAAEIFYSHIFLLQVMRPARIHWRC